MGKAWVVRAGREGQQEPLNLESGTATIGWNVGDLSGISSRDGVRELMEAASPEDSPERLANHTGQVWAFCSKIEIGDIVIMPSKLKPGYIYLGECTGPYRYVASEVDPTRRHQLPVKWKDDPTSKAVIKDDLLYSLNAIMTVFNPTRNGAAERLRSLYETGTDPGSLNIGTSVSQPPRNELNSLAAEVTDPDPTPTLDAIRDRIRTHLVENFGDHKLTRLIAEILEVLGFRCEVSPSGPDGAVDILAGSGPLGLDSPTLIVEVKSEPGPIDVKVVRGLHSAMTQYRADQALLVGWGGVTRPAAQEFRRDRTSLRIWDSEEILNRLFETYDRLPADTRIRIPLKQAWVLDEENSR